MNDPMNNFKLCFIEKRTLCLDRRKVVTANYSEISNDIEVLKKWHKNTFHANSKRAITMAIRLLNEEVERRLTMLPIEKVMNDLNYHYDPII